MTHLKGGKSILFLVQSALPTVPVLKVSAAEASYNVS